MDVRILAISGNLRVESSHTAGLRAARLLAPPGVEIGLYDALADLSAFNPDLDQPGMPLPHALIICSPEYAHGIPGRPQEPAGLARRERSVSGQTGDACRSVGAVEVAQAELAEVLRTMSARLVFNQSVVVPVPSRATAVATIAADPRLGEVLRGAMGALMQAIVRPTVATPGT